MDLTYILKSNLLIAKFMGGKTLGEVSFIRNSNEIWLPIHGVCQLDNNGKKLEYHKSFDWLISVYNKLNSPNIELDTHDISKTYIQIVAELTEKATRL